MHVSSVLLSLASCASLSLAVPVDKPQWPEYADNAMLQSSSIEQTNMWRAYHQASDVTWNTTLADYAKTVANTCLMVHSKGPYGENLATNHETPADSIYSWGEESDGYDYQSGEFQSGKGHFSQLVWKSVTQIGCAATFCGRGNTNPGNKLAWGWMYVCEYAPKGNIGGGYLDNVLPAVG